MKGFETPKAEILKFDLEDILTASGDPVEDSTVDDVCATHSCPTDTGVFG